MIIHQNFIGGNITVKEIKDNVAVLENQIRDSGEDWFYWAFCVEGAENQIVKFKFQSNRLGYFGPAVSYDLVNWHWLDSVDGDSFTYRFSENESKVYFAHRLLYHPERFFKFADEHNIKVRELCKGNEKIYRSTIKNISGEMLKELKRFYEIFNNFNCRK